MDLWVICDTDKKKTLTKNMEYQVVDIDPLNAYVRVINDKDSPCWFSEECFKSRKDDLKMQKNNYKPFDMDINVSENTVNAEIRGMDPKLPEMDSLNKFLEIDAPFDIDISIVKSLGVIEVLVSEKDDRAMGGVYKSNAEALEFAVKARKAIDFYNEVLIRKPVLQEMKEVYKVEFTPGGKLYTFRSLDGISKHETVACRSSVGYDYGLVVEVSQEPKSDWEARAYCSKIKVD
jgi:hypothetical protein